MTVAIRPERIVIREGAEADGPGWTRSRDACSRGPTWGIRRNTAIATDALGEVVVRRPVTTGQEARAYGPGEGVDIAWHEDAVLVLVA